ncbi:MAG: HAD-IA family hydrolase [Tannerella sp.]|jgi:phosphoglycolate phosphatase|nr:HAD-IA family hydrolase [Tannerella sp.]
MDYSAVLFDFDYTLADSSRGIVMCFQNVLQRHEYHDVEDEDIKRTIGKPLEDSFSILTGIENMDRLIMMRKEYVKEADVYMNGNTFLFPETLPVIESLREKGLKTGIVSTKYTYRIKSFLEENAPAAVFDIIIGGEDVSRHKPDPEGLLVAMDRLNVTRKQTLYIGDSVVDAETALNAGVDFIGVTTGATTETELAVYPHIKIINNLGVLMR